MFVFFRQQSEEGDKNGSEEEDDEKPGKRVIGPRKKFIWDDRLRSGSDEAQRPNSFAYLNQKSAPKRKIIFFVSVRLQESTVQFSAREAELLWDGEAVLSVGGGLPQGLSGERGQTTVAQGLDAGQVCV